MGFQVGQRVQVKPGVSPVTSSKTCYPKDGRHNIDRSEFVGRKGEIVQIGKNGPCTVPDNYTEDQEPLLVDSHIANGRPLPSRNAVKDGPDESHMRSWFLPEEVDFG